MAAMGRFSRALADGTTSTDNRNRDNIIIKSILVLCGISILWNRNTVGGTSLERLEHQNDGSR